MVPQEGTQVSGLPSGHISGLARRAPRRLDSASPRAARPCAWPVLLLALLLLLSCLPARSFAAESRKADEIRRELERIQIRARDKRGAMRELTKRERELFSNLAELETRVNTLELDVYRQERQLERTEHKKRLLLARQMTLQAGRERSEAELREILRVLWPIHMSGARDQWQGVLEWQEADRRFTWLAAIYKRAEQVMADILDQSRAIEDSLAAEIVLTRELQEGMASLNKSKDELLTKKLALLKSIQEVRAEQVDGQEELRRILSTIADLDYKLKTLDKSPISEFKGRLPWPCKGNLVQRFDPNAESPSRGIGLAVTHEVEVNAVSWGRVVHDDRLRGFGHVVIVLHDQEYYSLYAYLTNSRVKVGQEVERGQALGTAGYYPAAKGNGLYFELRFGQKPINPLDWLSR